MKLTSRRPSASLCVSVAALLVALGGTSYAASQIRTKDIQDDAVISSKIKNGQVGSVDIKDGGIKKVDLAPGAQPQDGEDGVDGVDGVDGQDGEDGIGRWLLVDRNGAIVAQSGGFEITTAYDIVNNSGAAVPGGALGNVYIDANEDLSNNGIVVSIALQNQYDQNNDGLQNGRQTGADTNPEFSGEITATMCAIPMVVACAPTGANDTSHFVVSPRMSDGSLTVTGDGTPANPNTHKRFYVILTGDSSEYVPAP